MKRRFNTLLLGAMMMSAYAEELSFTSKDAERAEKNIADALYLRLRLRYSNVTKLMKACSNAIATCISSISTVILSVLLTKKLQRKFSHVNLKIKYYGLFNFQFIVGQQTFFCW